MNPDSFVIDNYINNLIEEEKSKSLLGTRFETKVRNKLITVTKFVPSATKGTILIRIDPQTLNVYGPTGSTIIATIGNEHNWNDIQYHREICQTVANT